MINRYPIWKNLLIAMLVTWGLIYALPNIYPPDFAIQISREEVGTVAEKSALDAVTEAFQEQGIKYFGAGFVKEGKLLFRFYDDETQLRARESAQRALHELPNVYIVALNSAATTPAWLRSIGAEPMKYGLDLRGGVHFLMEVDTGKAIQDRVSGMESEIKRMLRQRDDRIRYSSVEKPAEGVLKFIFANSDLRDRARRKIAEQYGEFDILSGEDAFPFVQLTVTDSSVREMEDFAVSQNLQTIRNRVNELGVSEPLVQRLGRNRIVVDLPGVQDTAEAKKILGKVATLEFRMEALPDSPRSTTIAQEYEGRNTYLEKDVILRGDRVFDAQVGFDPDSGLPQVNITLDSDGGELMHRSTRHSIGRRMAVIFIETKTRDKYEIVDGIEVRKQIPYIQKKVISLATVQAALGVKFRITGLDAGEARELALLLRAGALAADMFIVEERTVGASLGAENIRLGAVSVMVGMTLVLIFMFIYYRVFGLAANIALAANLVLLVAVMSLLGATLTLPGIAGIVLTVGMAVDANVLIFSRIREELKNEMSPQAAINAGFERAFVTIMDANLTTLIVAVILYSIGTGPVKGFAVTLSIGILTSMFTAIMGTRALVNLLYGGRNVQRLLI
ncbi:MAG: protein translocase subunit SecD [Candidatus Azotimanducaceae bacterium]|uniref:Protein translocase subunit SecD n=1 Tax=OM182 bacterium TaxID=2510334 RepID=A0A520RZH7_9GAMM|nr:MAG: protein translocase subunit SecD [OM182 bacterium]